ncbi:MAG: alpha/beta hydrolase [Pirellulales bacterium]|nr:alpha/beta hydrolase [Pirellulales bacterium]
MPHVALDGLKFHYQQSGSGPDVVLLHGFTSNLAMWLFSGIVPALANRFRVTTYDLRGHGASDAPPAGYTSREMAGDLARLCDALELGPAYLVGHSFGGVVAAHLASLEPTRVAGLILCDSYFPGLAELEPEMERVEVWRGLAEVLDEAGLDVGQRVDFSRLLTAVANLTSEQRTIIETRLGPPAIRWLAQLAPLAATSAARDTFTAAGLTAERLAELQVPVVALYDEHSPFQATCRYLAAHVADCTVDFVPGAKHLALLESPAEFVARVAKHLDALAARQNSPLAQER